MKWTVRSYEGHPLGILTCNSIDVALTLARSKYRSHDVTVDNLPPLGSPKSKAVIRYLEAP